MNTDDPYDLQRFVAAQDAGDTYARATAELRAGRKASHWMWFVFPQIAGLGYSPTARTYAITSLAEARAYLAHPVLGPRLTECAAILAGCPAAPPSRSSATLTRRSCALPSHCSARRSRRAGVPPGPRPVFRRSARFRDAGAHLTSYRAGPEQAERVHEFPPTANRPGVVAGRAT